VLGECIGGTSNIEEAITCAEKAHKLEADNAEVTAQLQELRILLGDIRSEEKVRAIASGPQSEKLAALRGDPSADSGGAKAPESVAGMSAACESILSDMLATGGEGDMATAAGFYIVDDLKKRLDEILAVLELDSADAVSASTTARDTGMIDAVVGLLDGDKSCRVYLRTNGGLAVLLQCAKIIASDASLFTAAARPVLSLLGPLLRVLSAAVQSERTSKMTLLADPDIISSVKSILTRADAPVEVTHASVIFVAGCTDNCCTKLRALVVKDSTLVVDFGAVLCHLNDILCGRVAGSNGKEHKSKAAAAMVDCCKLIRDLTFSDDWKKGISPVAVMIVNILGSVLSSRDIWKKALKAETIREIVEGTLESLLGCSQSESLRDAFLLPLETTDSAAEATTNRDVTSVHVVLGLCQKEKWACANGLAILMNVTIQENAATRMTVLSAGGMDVCLSILQSSVSAGEEYARVRAIGLLSRLSTLPEVQDRIKQADVYGALCSSFLQNTRIEKVNGVYEKWVLDERSQLVRTIASVSNPGDACLDAGGQQGMVQALLGCLPTPRQELLKITRTSVILPPEETINPILLGNIARCLMPYADHKIYAATLYTDPKNIGVEKLICMMASCTDMRVRKNIAILMAKGCRIPSAKARIEELRGLQMLVELQDKL
jgi:phosphotransferase system IIB component